MNYKKLTFSIVLITTLTACGSKQTPNDETPADSKKHSRRELIRKKVPQEGTAGHADEADIRISFINQGVRVRTESAYSSHDRIHTANESIILPTDVPDTVRIQIRVPPEVHAWELLVLKPFYGCGCANEAPLSVVASAGDAEGTQVNGHYYASLTLNDVRDALRTCGGQPLAVGIFLHGYGADETQALIQVSFEVSPNPNADISKPGEST